MENIKSTDETFDIVILVNGPGELSSFVKPTVEALNKKSQNIRIILVITPCPYSTGKEAAIAGKMAGVSKVLSKDEFIRLALINRRPKDLALSRSGIVVFMGGDILYGKIIARRLKYPAIAYSEAYAKWPNIYRKFLVPDQFIFDKFKKQGFPQHQIRIVGNLMADSIKLVKTREDIFRNYGLDTGRKLISFLPGSRPFQVHFTLPFYAKTAYEIVKLNKDFQFAYIISPFLPDGILEKELQMAGFQMVNDRIKYKDISIVIINKDQHDAIAASDLVITIPGTNTAEVAIIGTPMISIFPLDSSQMIPLEGIFEIIGKLPGLGFFFKKLYVKMAQRRARFFAIPNMKAGKEIVPELLGNVQPDSLAEKAVFLLNDTNKLAQMKKELRDSLGGPGAASKVAEVILNEVLH